MRPHPATLVLATVLLAACERDGPIAPLRPATPLMEIADASRDPARLHFYFLPPMAAQPAYAGAFNASLLPYVAVEVCELAGAGCGAQVARFTAASQGLERVSTSEFFEHYLAVWRTDGPTVRAGAIYRVTVLASGTALGYADVKVVRTLTEARSVDRTQYAVALKGLPLPIRFRIETGAVFPVGPSGGHVTAAGGVVQLEFPAGAVSSVIGVTVAPATSLPADVPAPVAGTAFDFGPDGATFAAPVKLTIRYADGTPDEAQLRLHKLVGTGWQLIAGSAVDVEANTVTGNLSGFSEYAVLPARPDPGLGGDIAFVSDQLGVSDGRVDVFLMKEDGSNPVPLTNGVPRSQHGNPVWSPTGDKLAFLRTDGGEDGLYVIGAVALDFKKVIAGSLIQPSWTSAGPRGDLFFLKNIVERLELRGRIYSAHSTGSTAEEMVFNGIPAPHGPWYELPPPFYTRSDCVLSYSDPQPSADGSRLAFSYSADCLYTHTDPRHTRRRTFRSIAVVNTATGDVVADLAGRTGAYPQLRGYALSPKDPNKLALVAADVNGEGHKLFLVDLATLTTTNLLDSRLFGMPPDEDGQLRELAFFHIGDLAWSPNGDKLAFVLEPPGSVNPFNPDFLEILVLDMSVTPNVVTNVTASPGSEWGATWSPDGTKIAFVSNRDGDDEIYVVNLAQPGVARQLTDNAFADHSPRWRP